MVVSATYVKHSAGDLGANPREFGTMVNGNDILQSF